VKIIYGVLVVCAGYVAILFLKGCVVMVQFFKGIRAFVAGCHWVKCGWCGAGIFALDGGDDGYICRDCNHIRGA